MASNDSLLGNALIMVNCDCITLYVFIWQWYGTVCPTYLWKQVFVTLAWRNVSPPSGLVVHKARVIFAALQKKICICFVTKIRRGSVRRRKASTEQDMQWINEKADLLNAFTDKNVFSGINITIGSYGYKLARNSAAGKFPNDWTSRKPYFARFDGKTP